MRFVASLTPLYPYYRKSTCFLYYKVKMRKVVTMEDMILEIYRRLLFEYGHRNWWPAKTPFEVIIGAILTQNVSWKNVRTAINNLKSEGLLDFERLHQSEVDTFALLIRSSRYYNQKAKKIKRFIDFFYDEYEGNFQEMIQEETLALRSKLLNINGLGEETVDSILLYACNKPVFVVDAYTKRIFSRYGLITQDAKYKEIQNFFMRKLPHEIGIYNDFHAQLVHLGNEICKTHPNCNACPILQINSKFYCHYGNKKP